MRETNAIWLIFLEGLRYLLLNLFGYSYVEKNLKCTIEKLVIFQLNRPTQKRKRVWARLQTALGN